MRGFGKFLFAVAMLLVVAVIGDRAAAYAAGQLAAQAMGDTFGGTPEVSFGGFPFLTQWGTGDYQQVNLTQDRASVGGTTLTGLRVTARDLHTRGFVVSGTSITDTKAGSVTATGTVPYRQLPLPAGIDARRAGTEGNRLKLSGTAHVLGQKVPVDAVVTARLRDGTVRLKPQRVHVGGRFTSDAATKLVRRTLTVRVTPPGLPAGFTLTGMKVTAGGIAITATGHDVGLPGS